MGLGLIVVTNQSGIGRGFFDTKRLELIHERLSQLLEEEGVRLDGIYFCPHVPEDDCECRKPKTGMLESAGKELNFDPRTCFVVGDKASDIGLGKNAGATTLLVRTGYGAQVDGDGQADPDCAVSSLLEATQVIQQMLNTKDHGDEVRS
jgi:D-glycero-D-manno-heptose 1,7-bisphosphate phosphatase